MADRAPVDGHRRRGRWPVAHGALAQRPGRDRHGDVHPRPRAAGDRGAAGPLDGDRPGTPRRTWTGRCPATRTFSAPSPCTCAPPAGVLRDVPARCAALLGGARLDDRSPLGAGALAGVGFAIDRRLVAASWASPASRRTRSTPSPTATSCSTSSAPPPPARRTCRGWAPSSCCGPLRSSVLRGLGRLGVGFVDHAAEEEPRRGRAVRAKAPRVVADLAALHGVMHGAPADLQQGHAGGQGDLFDVVDTLELCLAAARGMLGGITFHRDRLASRGVRRDDRRVDVADLLVRRGVPFRQSHGVVAGLVRSAVESGPIALGAFAARIWRDIPTSWTTNSTWCSPRARGSNRRSAKGDRAGPRARAARARPRGAGRAASCRRTSSSVRCSRSRPTCSAASSCTAIPRGRDRRDRGVPLHRAGLSCLRRA